MVKVVSLFLALLFVNGTLSSHYKNQEEKYKIIFNNVSLCAAFKGIEINEDDGTKALFNKDLIDHYFHTCWEKVSSIIPSKYSIVTFDDFGISEEYGTSVQIKVYLNIDLKTFFYSTQYNIGIKGENYENQ